MILLRTFGLGRLPSEAGWLIPHPSRVIECEHLSCWVTYRDFRAPGRACNWKRQWFAGSLALSEDRLIAFQWRSRLFNTGVDDPRFSGLAITAEDQTLIVSLNASLYRDDWSGFLEYQFRTPEADRIVYLLRQLRRRSSLASF
ncbi:hypothetical protein [Candidatus Laterigemmans baculatus]|uniref:hypothetical protein n=1 Tax=Candidatus Laterigemmans baculatus TaxID=2770505 RepID=UPI0013DAE91E|nr:hypothetical protein [Candidatus Laterigemmans baculatus]